MSKSRTLLMSAATFVVLSSAAVGIWLTTVASKRDVSPKLKPDVAPVVARGRSIYVEHCASCHGTKLEGETSNWRRRDADGRLPAPPHDATGHTWHHTDQVLFDLTKHGLGKIAGTDTPTNMPAFSKVLTDAEIIATLSYIKAQWPADIRARHDRLNALQNEQ